MKILKSVDNKVSDYIRTRSFLIQNTENILEYLNAKRADKKNETDDLFDFDSQESNFSGFVNWDFETKNYSELEILQEEKNSLGIYVSGNPLQKYQNLIEYLKEQTLEENLHLILIEKVRKIFTRNNSMMIAIEATSTTSNLEAIIFPKNAAKLSVELKEKSLFWIYGKINQRKEEDFNQEEFQYDQQPKLIIENLAIFEVGILPLLQKVGISLAINRVDKIKNLNWQNLRLNPDNLEQKTDKQNKDNLAKNLEEKSAKILKIKLKKGLDISKLSLIKKNLSPELIKNGQLVEIWVPVEETFKKVKGENLWLEKEFLDSIREILDIE
jgi:DNA polymerase III alpha subunit